MPIERVSRASSTPPASPGQTRVTLAPPSRQVLEDPAQHQRYMRELAQTVQTLSDRVHAQGSVIVSRGGESDSTKAQDQAQILSALVSSGQEALTGLGIDLSAQARSNISDSAPTTDDDSSKGYNYFSQWIDTTAGKLYKCIDPSPGGAVWVVLN